MKVLFGVLISLLVIVNVNAEEKILVEFSECVDGDTAWLILDNEEIKVRFLAIDTPESTNKIEPYGEKASLYTCQLLSNANKIEIEYDDNSDKLDKYNRHLVWVFVDDKLLQNKIIEKGLGKIDYVYGDYKYLDELKSSQLVAKMSRVGIWENSYDYIYYIVGSILIIIIIIICIINKKFRSKILVKVKKVAKKELKKTLE